jgi:hypothetical protein
MRSRLAGVTPRYTLKDAVPAVKLKPERVTLLLSCGMTAVTTNERLPSLPEPSTPDTA